LDSALDRGGAADPRQDARGDAKAHEQFDEAGRMRPSPYYDRLVDVMEELLKFAYLTRGVSDYLTSRYSECKQTEEAEKFSAQAGLQAA
jgi:arsenic resistance protein ArsH